MYLDIHMYILNSLALGLDLLHQPSQFVTPGMSIFIQTIHFWFKALFCVMPFMVSKVLPQPCVRIQIISGMWDTGR